MPVEITNVSQAPLWLVFNSHESRRLSPGQASGPIPDAEVAGNDKIAKLSQQRLIVVNQVNEPATVAGREAPVRGEKEEPEVAAEAAGEPVEEPESRKRSRAGGKNEPAG